ncbi:histone-like nucleoid-structuring protein, MvaT/MvaU family [Marinospirillum perlucidum]|uniref:histone-like nucleoid-structuring protein, MvaT/MvaU family n=1 Tax=Marinospirillum perlucidum TaxID=1982602 RepID=UPI000DF2E58A|nr:histone-like nucleoid-structuring protein, MvaT/MvaU family [Marinospirillum perlucidum]
MSILASYREKEELMRKLQDELRKMEENTQLKKELTFKQEIESVLDKHGRSVKDLVEIFDLAPETAPKSGKGNRRTRKMKVYVNPKTGERIETRGGNQKQLKAWKAEHGSDVVEGWVVEEKD